MFGSFKIILFVIEAKKVQIICCYHTVEWLPPTRNHELKRLICNHTIYLRLLYGVVTGHGECSRDGWSGGWL